MSLLRRQLLRSLEPTPPARRPHVHSLACSSQRGHRTSRAIRFAWLLLRRSERLPPPLPSPRVTTKRKWSRASDFVYVSVRDLVLQPLPRAFHVSVLAVGLLTAVASTWPVAAHLSDHVVDGARLVDPKNPDAWGPRNLGADVLTTVWILNWDLHALVTQPLHLFEANIFYPSGLSLARSESMVGTALLGVPGRLLGGPVFAHQTALLLCLILDVWAAAYVVARWSGSLVGGLVAGVLFALSPFHQHQVFHLQSLATPYFPFIVLGLERLGATGGAGWAMLAAGALALQILSGEYLGYFGLAVFGVGAVVALLAARTERPVTRRISGDAFWLATASAGAALIVLPFVLPYIRLLASGELPDNSTFPMMYFGIDLGTYIHGRAFLGGWVRIAPTAWVLVAFGAVTLGLGSREARVRLVLLVLVGLVGALLSVGPRPNGLGLYGACAKLVPGFRVLREPGRWCLLPHFAVAMLAGVGGATLARRLPHLGPVLAALLVAAAVAPFAAVPVPLRALPVGPDLPQAYRYLARCGAGDPVLELPVPATLEDMTWRDAERDFFSVFHWLPLLNGRTGYAPPLYLRVMTLAGRLPEASALAELRDLTGVRWILIDCTEAPERTASLCRGDSLGNAVTRRWVFADRHLLDLGPVPALPRPWSRRWPAAPDCDGGHLSNETDRNHQE